MREIKFRVWQTTTNKMLDHGWLLSAGTVYEAVFNPKEYNKVMRFTGLKDKNGKEIYEGDIVEISYDRSYDDSEDDKPHIKTRGVVSWNPHHTGWVLGCKSPMSVNEQGTVMSSIIHGSDGYCEVIGNIYQHPELCEK